MQLARVNKSLDSQIKGVLAATSNDHVDQDGKVIAGISHEALLLLDAHPAVPEQRRHKHVVDTHCHITHVSANAYR
jgi:hypothetical protein